VHASVVLPEPVRLREWQPVFPAGELRSISLHWTAGDYETVSEAYHFCLRGAHDVVVQQTNDLRHNMRDVREQPGPYAAHTSGRNSWSVGIAICAMRGARPDDFGTFPLTGPQLEALCAVAARVARAFAIPPQAIRTHAEAALEDGYFGADGEDLRWDIARLAPAAGPLRPDEARAVGDDLRARIAAVP
jgi:hypothetical protein